MIAVAASCAPIAKYYPAMADETEFDAIGRVRTCNLPPAGRRKTRNQSPLGRFQHGTVRRAVKRMAPEPTAACGKARAL
jgi:hypothetical protein